MVTGTLTSKGQTTVPKPVREALNLKPGDKLSWLIEDGCVTLRARNKSIRELAGILRQPGARPKTLDEIDEGIAQAASVNAMAGLRTDR